MKKMALSRRVVLSAREDQVLALRFGLYGDSERTLKDIGRELGVTGQRIRQIEQSALRKLWRKQH